MSHTRQSPGGTSVAARLPGPTSPSGRLTLRNFLHRKARPALLMALTLLLCFSVPGDVKAGLVLQLIEFPDNDNEWVKWTEWWKDTDSGIVWAIYYNTDGTVEVHGHTDNPDPGGESSGPKGDRQSLIALAKQHGCGNRVSQQEFWNSPLGQMLTAKGKGPGPVINPSDDDQGGGPAAPKGDPDVVSKKLGDHGEIIGKTGPIGSGEGFQFNAGSPTDQLKKPGGPGDNQGGGGSDDDDKGSNKPPPGSNFGPAELVDPLGPPIARPAQKRTGIAD
jgi:hypothetical protein